MIMYEKEKTMKNIIDRFGMGVALLGALFLAITVLEPWAGAAAPCCAITAIDVKTGVVTAKETATGQTFQFKVTDAALLNSLKVGQGVYANFKTRQVSVNGANPCCSIVSLGKPGGLGNTPAGQMPQSGVPQSAPMNPGKPGAGPFQNLRTTQIDPCNLAGADALKTLLQGGLQKYFPYSVNHEGEHIKISDPTIEQVNCPNLRIKMKAHVQYRETRGFPQYETGGTVEIDSPLVAKVQYHGSAAGNEVVTVSNFVRAAAVLTHPNIDSLQIDNVPGWLTPSWIRDCLNGKYSNWGCHDILHQMSFDVTDLVKLYLAQGNTIAASSPAPNAKPSGFPLSGSSQPGEIGPPGETGPDTGFGGGQYGGQYSEPAYREQRAPVDPNELAGKIPGTNPNDLGGSEGYSIQGDRPWYEKLNQSQGNLNNPNNLNNNPNNFNSGNSNNYNGGTGGGFQPDTTMQPDYNNGTGGGFQQDTTMPSN